MDRPRQLLVAAMLVVGSFGLGVAVTSRTEHVAAGPSAVAAPAVPRGAVASPPPPSDAAAPKILIDPAAVNLLPDASLRLELPAGFDAGAGP